VLTRELEVAVATAREAGRILMRIYETDFDVELKGAADPVTEADRQANTFIVERLRAAFPDDGVVAEESSDNAAALGKSRIWYVDPLDGTKEFVSRNGEFSVMIGLSIGGESRLGVVYQPALDKLYRGVVGQGAALEQGGELRALGVSSEARPAALRLIVSRSHRSRSLDAVVAGLGITSERPSGSVGLKIGHIVEQSADLYVHVSDRSSAWDACGPEAVLRAAGGRFTDLSGQPFVYGVAELGNKRGILACNAAAFEAVLPVVARVGRDAGYV
jgi:3'(2'), 5'-bisphosphate nucleotidase